MDEKINIKFGKLSWRNRSNSYLIPVTELKLTSSTVKLYNDELTKCKRLNYNKIIRTPRGYISKKTRLPAYDVRMTTSCVELTVIDVRGPFRLQMKGSTRKTEEKTFSGHKAFKIFVKMCKAVGIDLDSYKINNGQEVKKEIGKYQIELMHPVLYAGRTFHHVNHIDFHSSFPSGLVNTHPEFRPVIEKLYNGRKDHPEYKLILNATIGYMQSVPCCGAKWANLSRDAINDNNARIFDLIDRLTKSGRMVLATNTDGIWYVGEPYHGKGEGSTICTWHNDHINCDIRFKSAGSYEFVENGVYTPVVRGYTKLDEIKPRSEWVWGDIFKIEADPKKINFVLNNDDSIELIDTTEVANGEEEKETR